MERTLSGHDVYEDDEFVDDRRSRFQGLMGHENGAATHQSRASSQPPRASEHIPPMFSSPPAQHFMPSSLGGAWSSSRNILASNRTQPTPIRSSSFSSQSHLGSAMRDSHFPSTFEDDESEALSDIYDERFLPPSLSSGRGRSPFGHDPTRSRSQSLATGRQAPIGSSPYLGTTTAMQSWNESYLTNNGLKPPGPSRYGSLGGSSAAPIGRHDISNMSPFVRDVGAILLDDGLYTGLGMNPSRDDGGGSGTTSRRHSVSVVQPRRGNVVGFNAPGASDLVDEQPKRAAALSGGATVFGSGYASASAGNGGGRGGGGLMLTDDDLADDLGMLNLGGSGEPSHQQPPSQPSSLPIYAPKTRSPAVGKDLLSNYQAINLTIPSAGSYSRQAIGTPSDGGYDGGNNSPSISAAMFEQRLAEARAAQQQKEAEFRFQLLQQQRQEQQQAQANSGQYVRTRAPSYTNTTAALHSPISPTRVVNPQQPPFYPQTQRRLSDAHQPPTPSASHHPHGPGNLSELGKGLPLHAVPPNWPLFIVEFKAGRTDLFYLPPVGTNVNPDWDISPDRDIRVGDLVIVEADRGKDLGKVVNDRITLEEVETFQRMQAEKASSASSPTGGANEPTSPVGGSAGDGASGNAPPTPGGKKEISPKMIYGKAGAQDVQLYAAKTQDELKALQLCQSKVRAKKLPMEVIDAEYQWDRRKLTFYFIAEKRIDFRELVRELFRLYKTRIWMASLQGGLGFEQ
ncbi:PSP1 C-terminal conserved region-domain-containing protein [Crepidotus variabilis]|uniref:PSP1 C-terminal conserved region-domain-containing protein n=1 Tax=Crepidotus variabilis TaxID=179855 RepID=A0A9P6EDV5_9AGAR|nr:PSP1 C-terminal conserved region-domain-containing protein [Crepidotus variabilis]